VGRLPRALALRGFQIEVISFVAKSPHASSSNILGRVQLENSREAECFKWEINVRTCSNCKIKPTIRRVVQCFRMQSFRRIAAY
jgi:hypothetical protein